MLRLAKRNNGLVNRVQQGATRDPFRILTYGAGVGFAYVSLCAFSNVNLRNAYSRVDPTKTLTPLVGIYL